MVGDIGPVLCRGESRRQPNRFGASVVIPQSTHPIFSKKGLYLRRLTVRPKNLPYSICSMIASRALIPTRHIFPSAEKQNRDEASIFWKGSNQSISAGAIASQNFLVLNHGLWEGSTKTYRQEVLSFLLSHTNLFQLLFFTCCVACCRSHQKDVDTCQQTVMWCQRFDSILGLHLPSMVTVSSP